MINENLNENKNLDDANVEEGIETFSEFENYSDFEKDIYKGRFILDKKQQFIINSKITRAEINNKTNIFVISTENGMFSIYDSQTFENKYSLQITDTKINSLSISNNGVQLAFGSKKLNKYLFGIGNLNHIILKHKDMIMILLLLLYQQILIF